MNLAGFMLFSAWKVLEFFLVRYSYNPTGHGKVQTEKTPNSDTFRAIIFSSGIFAEADKPQSAIKAPSNTKDGIYAKIINEKSR